MILYFGVFLLLSMSGALTSTQHGALAQYYPVEVRTRAILAHRFVGVLALRAGRTGRLPVRPGLLLAGAVLRPGRPGHRAGGRRPSVPALHREQNPTGVDLVAAQEAAEGPATLPEATRVLFSVPSIRSLYRALPLLSVTFFGIAYYANLLYLNVFHQNAASRRMALDVALFGAAAGVLAGRVDPAQAVPCRSDPGACGWSPGWPRPPSWPWSCWRSARCSGCRVAANVVFAGGGGLGRGRRLRDAVGGPAGPADDARVRAQLAVVHDRGARRSGRSARPGPRWSRSSATTSATGPASGCSRR